MSAAKSGRLVANSSLCSIVSALNREGKMVRGGEIV